MKTVPELELQKLCEPTRTRNRGREHIVTTDYFQEENHKLLFCSLSSKDFDIMVYNVF